MKNLALLFMIFSVSAHATNNKVATISCRFSEKSSTTFKVDLKTRIAKQVKSRDSNEFPIIGDMVVIAHTTLFGDQLSEFNETSITAKGQKVHWDAQLVLVGSNQDDSNFTLVVGYQFAQCQAVHLCSNQVVKATLISNADGLDGASSKVMTDQCTIALQ